MLRFLTFCIIFHLCVWGIRSYEIEGEEIHQVSGWGKWGKMETCPIGTYASAFQNKNQANQGSSDDSALNGLRLFCAKPGTPNKPDLKKPIASTVGIRGDWKRVTYCDGGLIRGVQLRVEKAQGNGDDTALNDVAFYCSNKKDSIQGGGSGWGTWGKIHYCLQKQYVCGIQTKVDEHPGGSYDYVGMVNLRLKCCDIVSSAQTCKPSDKWETVLTCAAPRAYKHEEECKYEVKQGVVNSKAEEKGGHETSGSEHGFEAEVGASGKILSASFRTSSKWTSETGHNWRDESSQTFSKETTHSATFKVSPGRKIALKQVVGHCGDFTVFSGEYKLFVYDEKTGKPITAPSNYKPKGK